MIKKGLALGVVVAASRRLATTTTLLLFARCFLHPTSWNIFSLLPFTYYSETAVACRAIYRSRAQVYFRSRLCGWRRKNSLLKHKDFRPNNNFSLQVKTKETDAGKSRFPLYLQTHLWNFRNVPFSCSIIYRQILKKWLIREFNLLVITI